MHSEINSSNCIKGSTCLDAGMLAWLHRIEKYTGELAYNPFNRHRMDALLKE
jgi:hypothetical protein